MNQVFDRILHCSSAHMFTQHQRIWRSPGLSPPNTAPPGTRGGPGGALPLMLVDDVAITISETTHDFLGMVNIPTIELVMTGGL